MEKRETILNELKASSTILDKGIELPYIFSANYFDNFSANMLDNIKENVEEYVPVTSVPNFSLPEGYFSNLSDNILASIKKDEIKQELQIIAPTLASISNTLPYQVSSSYFDNFTANHNQFSKNHKEAKVVSITLYKRKWFQIAVAASIAGLIAISGYFANNNTSSSINTYASYKSVDVQGSARKVSDDDLEKYLNNNDNLTSNTDIIIGDENEDLNPKQEIESVSDNELKQYLKEAGDGKKTVKKGI